VYKATYLPPAITDLFEIEEYLNEYSPTAADRFEEAVDQRVTGLSEHPLMCPAYERDPFFRKIVLGDYLLFYSVDEKRELIAFVKRNFNHII